MPFIGPQPTPTNTPTPTPSVYELPFPEAVDIGPIPTPANLAEWKDSTPHPDYQWSFKYPPNWEEIEGLMGYYYAPKDAIRDNGDTPALLSFYWEEYSVDDALRGINIGKGNTPIIKRERFNIGKYEVEMIVTKSIYKDTVTGLDIFTYIKGIQFKNFKQGVDYREVIDDGICVSGAMLDFGFSYNGPPAFTDDNIPYENDIKQMLTTFNITDCVPAQ